MLRPAADLVLQAQGLALIRLAPLLLLAALLAPAVAKAAAPGCPPPRALEVRVEIQDPEPGMEVAAVDALHAATGEPRRRDTHHLGLTTSRVEWRSELSARILRASDGRVCAVPGEVRLILSHAEHRIRIAREVPRNGCLWREVLAHERRHVEVNRRTLRRALDDVRSAAEAWARRAEARGRDSDAALDRLQDGLRRAIEPALARMRADRGRAHRAIDAPEEYRRLGRICPGDQAKLRDALRAH